MATFLIAAIVVHQHLHLENKVPLGVVEDYPPNAEETKNANKTEMASQSRRLIIFGVCGISVHFRLFVSFERPPFL